MSLKILRSRLNWAGYSCMVVGLYIAYFTANPGYWPFLGYIPATVFFGFIILFIDPILRKYSKD